METITKEMEAKASTEALKSVIVFVDEQLAKADCPMKIQFQIELAVEEIFVNIASYAYPPGQGSAKIIVTISGDPPEAEITFIDNGICYDPLARKDPDVTLSAKDRKIGGLGIFLTKKNMDDVTYEYRDGYNILTMRKKLVLE